MWGWISACLFLLPHLSTTPAFLFPCLSFGEQCLVGRCSLLEPHPQPPLPATPLYFLFSYTVSLSI